MTKIISIFTSKALSMNTKICNKCGVEKTLDNFYEHSHKDRRWLAADCKPCRIARTKELKWSKRKNIPVVDLDCEEWRWITGYEGYYKVSNLGRVKGVQREITDKLGFISRRYEKLLKPKYDEDGYNDVVLNKQGNRGYLQVHQLVAKAFIDNPNNLPIVNHKNAIRDDNKASNLEWSTVEYNNRHKMYTHGRKYFKKKDSKLSKAIVALDANDLPGTIERILKILEWYGFTEHDVMEFLNSRNTKSA